MNAPATSRLILASTSAYRRALLERLGVPFDCVAPEVDELRLGDEPAAQMSQRLARLKAEVPLRIHYDQLYFAYKKSDPGVNDNENENLAGGDPLPGT